MVKYFIKYKVADYNKLPQNIKAELLQKKEDAGLYVFVAEDIDTISLTTLKKDFFNQTNPLELTYILNFFNALFNTNIDLGKSAVDVSSTLDKVVQVYLLDWCKKCNLSHAVQSADELTTKIVGWWKRYFPMAAISHPKVLKDQLLQFAAFECIKLSKKMLQIITGISWYTYYYYSSQSKNYSCVVLLPEMTLENTFAEQVKASDFFGNLFANNLYYYEIAVIDESGAFYNINDIDQLPASVFIPGGVLKPNVVTTNKQPTTNDMEKIFKNNILSNSSVDQIYLKKE